VYRLARTAHQKSQASSPAFPSLSHYTTILLSLSLSLLSPLSLIPSGSFAVPSDSYRTCMILVLKLVNLTQKLTYLWQFQMCNTKHQISEILTNLRFYAGDWSPNIPMHRSLRFRAYQANRTNYTELRDGLARPIRQRGSSSGQWNPEV